MIDSGPKGNSARTKHAIQHLSRLKSRKHKSVTEPLPALAPARLPDAGGVSSAASVSFDDPEFDPFQFDEPEPSGPDGPFQDEETGYAPSLLAAPRAPGAHPRAKPKLSPGTATAQRLARLVANMQAKNARLASLPP